MEKGKTYERGRICLIRNKENGICKIGYTAKGSCVGNLKDARRGIPGDLEIIRSVDVDPARKVCEMVKARLVMKRVDKSWYDLDEQDIEGFEKLCESQEEIARSLGGNPYFNDSGAVPHAMERGCTERARACHVNKPKRGMMELIGGLPSRFRTAVNTVLRKIRNTGK